CEALMQNRAPRNDGVFSRPVQRRGDGVERRLRLAAVRAAGLRHVGAAAAALAAERLRAPAHQLDRVEALGEIGRDPDHEARPAFIGHADDGDDTGADLLLAVVGEALQILDLDAGHRAGQELDIADLADAVLAGASAAAHRELAPRVGEFALEPLAVV